MFYAYVLKNPRNGFPSYTAKRGPWKLVYFEEFNIRIEAEKREKFFKSGKGREFLKNKLDTMAA